MLGQTVERDHEIRYFAVDNRLCPRAGRYTADAQYNAGQPMGIFAAPTILSGQDPSTFMTEGTKPNAVHFTDEMTREEVDEAIRQDVLNQQAGAEIDPVGLVDVRADHGFDTMVARTYVGYGASTLGVGSEGVEPATAQALRPERFAWDLHGTSLAAARSDDEPLRARQLQRRHHV